VTSDGNQVGKSKTGESWSYAYDHRGQMTQATSDTGVSVTYKFDAFGNRIERDATVGGVSSVEKFVVDGWDTTKPGAVGTENFDVAIDLDAAGNVTNRRLFGAGFDELLGGQDSAGAVRWYGTDHIGSVRTVFDNSGTVTNTVDYDAFGSFLGGVPVDRYAYTGREYDSVTGLTHYRAREKDGHRFLSEDPKGFSAGDPNLARYVGNSPTGRRDPSGNQFIPGLPFTPLSPDAPHNQFTPPIPGPEVDNSIAKSKPGRFIQGGIRGIEQIIYGPIIAIVEFHDISRALAQFVSDEDFRGAVALAIIEKLSDDKAENIGELFVTIPVSVYGDCSGALSATRVTLHISSKAAQLLRKQALELKRLGAKVIKRGSLASAIEKGAEFSDKAPIPPTTQPLAPGAGRLDSSGIGGGVGTVCEGKIAPATPLARGGRLTEYYNRLRGQPASRTADEALGRVGRTLDEVEDALSGIPKKNPPPPPNMPDGRMYPPQADNIVRHADGSITARTRGHDISIGRDGSITMTNRQTGKVDFQQPGAGN